MSSKKKGFTLAELLIVVAIIGVLVAISIPVFTSQLEKSREAADLANVRAAYAEVMAAAIGEDAEAEYNGVKIKQIDAAGNVVYTATVDLEQSKAGWTTKVPIEIGDVLFTGTEIEGKWVGSPCVEGTCEVSYTTAGGTCFAWSGESVNSSNGSSSANSVYNSCHDYFKTIADAVKKLNSGSYCLNSTCSNNGTITNVTSSVGKQLDELFDSDIATWAVIRDTNLDRTTFSGNNSYNSYLLSTFDITEMSVGTDVPAIYYLADGTYQVGYATVTTSSDLNNGKTYNIITREQDGDYAYTYSRLGGSGTVNTNYDYTNILKDTTTYTSLEEAQAAYKQLAGQYIEANPGVVEGNQ